MTETKKKIEAGYPLSELQRALLFNHRADPENDEGLIQMQFRLSGPLDRERFLRAWSLTFRQHPALRASVHWEKISQPVWVVHPEATPTIDWLEGAGARENDVHARWEAFLADDRRTPLELTRPPACRLTALEIAPDDHYFAWTSHHLLLDGWSAETILKDMLQFYADPDRRPVPLPTHKEYLRWQQQQDLPAGLVYWRGELQRHRGATLFRPGQADQRELRTPIETELRQSVEAYARANSLSLNTLIQGVWAVLLGKYFGSPTVCFGTTVSGRPAEIPQFEAVAGMYVNVLPKVIDLEQGGSFFADIQRANGLSQPHQYLSAEQLYGEAGLPFNSLLTVQNYPWNELTAGDLRVIEYRGDMTSTYPLTAVVVLRREWELVLRYRPDSLTEARVEWLAKGFRSLLRRLVDGPAAESFAEKAGGELPPVPGAGEKYSATPYAPPRTATQLELLRIWSDLLPTERIGIDGDFFDHGGTSFMALRLFGRIEERFGRKLSPAILLSHRTVRALATLLDETDDTGQWNNMVPLRVTGNRAPLFCFHAGEGHVLMYEELVSHLDPDRPVYALQPNGLDGASALDGSIEEMAAHYLAEIDKLSPPEPLNLLAYCYSGAVCLEIGRLLLEAGRPAPRIIGTDIDPPGKPTAAEGERADRRRGSPLWYWRNLRVGLWERAWEQLLTDFVPPGWLGTETRLRLRARRLKHGLIDAFNRYTWPDYDGEILLIRSRDLRNWASHDAVIASWRRLTGGKLRLADMDCGHEEFYREPAVAELATKVEDYLGDRP